MPSNDVVGIRSSNFKYFRDKNSKDKRIHLFDLKNDILEEYNSSTSNPIQVEKMENELQKLLNSKKDDIVNKENSNSDEIENELRKMGYV